MRGYMTANDIRSIRQLAEHWGHEISHSHLATMINNSKDADPKIGTLRLLADKMGMSFERFLFLAGYTESEGIGSPAEKLPESFRKLLEREGAEFMVVSEEARAEGIDPRTLLDFIHFLKNHR